MVSRIFDDERRPMNLPKLLVAALLAALSASAQPLTMTIDAGRTGPAIHPYIYGQFTENANNNFYHGGLWAEMVDDRKFFYPVNSSAELNPPSRVPILRWRPVGGEGVVTMDRAQAYSGDHSPRIA